MTTIAYKDGLIAYDSRLTVGNRIIYDDLDKRMVRDGVSFFISGPISDDIKLIDMYLGKIVVTPVENTGLVFDENGEMWVCGVETSGDEHSFWKMPILPDAPYAIGSGSAYALAAMDLGHSAEEAICSAILRDTYTGGTIRIFDTVAEVKLRKTSVVKAL